jgi:uncharacterized repeat protein (TIGR03803 family)
MTKIVGLKNIFCLLLICLATVVIAPAQTFTTLSLFENSNGSYPQSALVQGRDGNLYGTTLSGGTYLKGTAFQMTKKGQLGTFSFCSQTACPGRALQSGLVLGPDGSFYGTTFNGGANSDHGTIFKISSDGTLTTLYSFCAQPNCVDGAFPIGTLALGNDGNFYGTTYGGGEGVHGNDGTVYKVTPSGRLTTLYSFCINYYCTDGDLPNAGIVQGTDGNFYGTTANGGSSRGYGTVFKITTRGAFTRLYSFCSKSGCSDGWRPTAALLLASDGNFYGTTVWGGGNGPYEGTVFRITPSNQFATLYNFCSLPNCADGNGPYDQLIQATDGNLYGTTISGPGGTGTIFQLTLEGGLTTLYNFCLQLGCADGSVPQAGLVQATDGSFYGTTIHGGDDLPCGSGCGTVYSLDVGLTPFVAFVRNSGKFGQTGGILGRGFTGTSSVSFSGTPASFTVVSDTFIKATVPAGATSGFVTVATPTGTLNSNVPFYVIP